MQKNFGKRVLNNTLCKIAKKTRAPEVGRVVTNVIFITELMRPNSETTP